MYSNIFLAYIIVIVAGSFIYFYNYLKKRQRFMFFWGLAWLFYALDLICLIFYFRTEIEIILELRKLLDMFNILMLLFGSLAFAHTSIPTYWYRFSLYMLILAGVCIIYDVDLLSYYIPISIFQTIIIFIICYKIIIYWDMSRLKKYFSASAFFIWGIAKAVLPIWMVQNGYNFELYVQEIMASFMLNLFILAIYIQYEDQRTELAKHLYQTLVENTTDVIFYYKLLPYHAFEYVTPSIEKITGYKPEIFYKNPRFYINLIDKKYLDAIEDIFNGRIQSDHGQIMEFIKKDGQKYWGEIQTSIILNDSDEPVAMEGVLHDITEMKSAQLEQIKAKQSRDMLLSYISHELRTPVTAISGYLTALEDGIIKKKEAMEIIASKTMLLKKMVDDLDQLSKLETHQYSLEFMACTVTDLTDYLILEHDSQIKSTCLKTKIHYEKKDMETHWVIADQTRISQVFSNLLGNAIKYSKPGTDLNISFSVDNNIKSFVVDVTNTCEDIAPKDLLYIFDRFYQAHPFSSKKGTGRGLGLSIAKEIIQAHNGEIYMENEKDQDITFTFTIPLYKETPNGT